MAEHELIAVVGLAGRFPQARDLGEFWLNLRDGRECLSDLSDDDMLARGESPERLRQPSYVRRRPLLPDMEGFDARLFGMTPREAEVRDPQHRVFLETCHTLFEHAGYDPVAFPGRIGVFAGTNATRYDDLYLRTHPDLVRAVGEIAITTSNNPDYVTTFTAYKLGLRGPAMTLATACSTSLVAIHVACQALRSGDCDMAVAGGVEVEWPYGVGYIHNPGGIYAADGYCRPFDASASGTVFGSGAGAVLLKRLADALADRDTVYAVVRGSAVNNDGMDKVAFSAPSMNGQVACITDAIRHSGVDSTAISYVEAHGTATRIGDPIELRALTRAFGLTASDGKTGACGIGSVKSNVGHLGPAAGVAGFIKTVLALHHEVIPPNINFSEPNPLLELAGSPFHVVDKATPWPRHDGVPRRAGCSSFGIGGTNAHVILEEAPSAKERPRDERPHLVVWSAATPAALAETQRRLADHLAGNTVALADVAHTLRVGRRPRKHRDAVVASTPAELERVLGADPREPSAGPADGPVLLAFPGQGAQYAYMAHGLHAEFPEFRSVLDRCLSGFSDLLGTDLRGTWREAADEDCLMETKTAQPLLFSVSYALASTLTGLGLTVAGAIGHSLGELVAASVAGVFTEEDSLALVAERCRAMQEAPRGTMLAVAADEDALMPLLADGVSLAAVNGRRQVTVSGSEAAVGALQERLAAAGLRSQRLRTSHAYHSPAMSDAAERVRAAAERVTRLPPRFPLASGLTGAMEQERLASPSFWADQLTQPVRFFAAASSLLRDCERPQVLEAGPGNTLTSLLRTHPQARRSRAALLPVLPHVEPAQEPARYLEVIASLWRAGRDLDWAGLAPGQVTRVPLPGYPYERTRYFVDMAPAPQRPRHPATAAEDPGDSATAATVPQDAGDQPAGGIVPAGEPGEAGPSLLEVTWAIADGAATQTTPPPATPSEALTLLPRGAADARLVASWLQRAGLRPLRVWPHGSGTNGEHSVSAADRAQIFSLIGELARQRRLPSTCVYCAFDDPAPPDALLCSLLWLIQAMQRYRGEAGLRSWRLVVLTRHAADVGGDEPVDPGTAMLVGLLRTLSQEVDSVAWQLVDVGDRARGDTVVSLLRGAPAQVAAVRGGHAWVPAVRRLRLAPGVPSRLRRRGVYLITGGLGALGMACARALAETGLEPRLVLLGRQASESPETSGFLHDLRSAGADVLVLAADVADAQAMARVFADVRARFGTFDGVLHAAGVAGGGLLELRTPEEVAAVLRPKVTGGRVLTDLALAEPNLAFMVYFSSRAALTGLLGSGDYAAANAYLDALSRVSSGADARIVSVAWPAWSEAGMAVAGNEPRRDARPFTVEHAFTGEEWFLDEHRIARTPVLSGTTYLDLIVRAVRDRELMPAESAVALHDLVFLSPLRVVGETRVRLEFTARADGYHVMVSSSPLDRGTWTPHAEVDVLAVAGPAPDIRLDLLYQQWAEAGELQRRGQPRLLTLGPRWKNTVRRRTQGGNYLAELRLPEAYRDDLRDHPLHPALLDAATSVINPDEPGKSYLPFSYRQAVVHRSLPAELVAVTTTVTRVPGLVTADLDLYDLRGRQLVSIAGFCMREVAAEQVTRSVTEPAEHAVVQGAAPTASGGQLSPVAATGMLLKIINAELPPTVAVLPTGAPLSVPGHVMLGDNLGQPWTSAPVASSVSPPQASAPVPAALPSATLAAAGAADPASPASARATSSGSAGDQADGTAAELTKLWEEMIGNNSVGLDEDFFDLGGNSLTVVQLIARIRDVFDIEVGVGLIFEKRTIRTLGQEIDKLRAL